MAHVVLVHGIGHELDSADTIENEWMPALAGGVRTAGFPTVADRLWRAGPVAGGLEVRAAFYGQLFREPGVQGAASAMLDESDQLVEALALQCLRQAEYSECEEQRRIAHEELAALGMLDAGVPMGIRSVGRSLMARLARLPWFARLGMALAERFVDRNLRQVTRYFLDENVRKTAQQTVMDLLDQETRVMVAHSLGSVVAYEACFALERPLPLLVTIGSPLGLGNIVYARLRPQPPIFPPRVRRWLNIADRNDVVAAEANLRPFFSSVPEGAVFEPCETVNNGREAHRGASYLTSIVVGRPVAETLAC
jgi:hypothetical protein